MFGKHRHHPFMRHAHAMQGPDEMGWRGGGFMQWRGRGPHGRGGRFFDSGELKFVVLHLLSEKPAHGYELIREIEERLGGTYAPSPGVIYPTLTLLEELGYAVQAESEGARKLYAITDEGRAYLAENRSTVEDIFERIASFGTSFFAGPMMDVNHAFADLGRAAYGAATRTPRDAERLARIVAVLRKAATDIAAM